MGARLCATIELHREKGGTEKPAGPGISVARPSRCSISVPPRPLATRDQPSGIRHQASGIGIRGPAFGIRSWPIPDSRFPIPDSRLPIPARSRRITPRCPQDARAGASAPTRRGGPRSRPSIPPEGRPSRLPGPFSVPRDGELLCATLARLRAKGARPSAKGARLRAKGARLCARGPRLCARGPRLCARGPRLRARGPRLCAKGARPCARGPQLRATLVLPRVTGGTEKPAGPGISVARPSRCSISAPPSRSQHGQKPRRSCIWVDSR